MSLFPRFILRNLKRNRNVYLIRIKFGFVTFVDTLTTISNRIYKHIKKSFEVVTIRKSLLLKTFAVFHSIDIPSYNNCIIYRIQFCRISSQDTSRYKEYIFRNCLNYDVLGISDKQLFHFVSQYIKLENEV